ncbi:LpxB Lipid A disaccharide synthetase [Burkholderiaceae bacterium]
MSQTPQTQQIAMVAGEASGDLLASLLIPSLQQQWPGVQLHGIGGPRMNALGFESWWPVSKLAVRGYVEVLKHYREIVGIRRQLKQRLLNNRPHLFIGVDAPDFNLDLAKDLRQQGIPTVQFVCPSVWAWRAERLQKIRNSVDHVLCLFPFEPALLAQHGIAATFVGHPIAHTIPDQVDKGPVRAALGLDENDLVLTLMPGSRQSEIAQLAPVFLQAAKLLQQQHPKLRVLLPVAPGLMAAVQAHLQYSGLKNIRLLDGQSHAALGAADLVLVASGTATLEAALFKRPMVIAYKMPWLSWQITNRKRLQAWVGLPNILCQDFVVPELLQDAATPQAMANALQHWLDHPEQVNHLQQAFQDLHQSLKQDMSSLARHALQKIIAA